MYLLCIKVYSENKVCLLFISMEWNMFPSDGQLKKLQLDSKIRWLLLAFIECIECDHR